MSFLKSLAELDSIYDSGKNTEKRHMRERKAAAGLFNWEVISSTLNWSILFPALWPIFCKCEWKGFYTFCRKKFLWLERLEDWM